MNGRSYEPDASVDTRIHPSTCSVPSKQSYGPAPLLVLGHFGSPAHKTRIEDRGNSAAIQHPLLIHLQSFCYRSICLSILAKSMERAGHIVQINHNA
jgi:hypothetical protein